MKIYRIIRSLINHPHNSDNKLGAILRFIKWQINCRLSPFPIIYPFTKNSKLIIWKGLTGATGNLYSGLLEYDDMGFLLHLLREDDYFLDIGANVGVYTILASAEIKANSIAVEPIPTTFKNLKNNILINNIEDKVISLNIGLGNKKEVLRFTKSFDSVNHVASADDNNTIAVQVERLDDLLESNHIPVLIKIDVEGFETEVLNGANKVLSNNKLKAIIIELNGSGRRYGYDEDKIHEKLLALNFTPHLYNPKSKKLRKIDSYGNHNTIYIRDVPFVKDRLLKARKIEVGLDKHLI